MTSIQGSTSYRLNQKWGPRNRLTAARDRHYSPYYSRMNDPKVIASHNNHIIRPPIQQPISKMVYQMRRPIIPHMVRQMGETTIDQRRARVKGHTSFWADTPVAKIKELGDPEILEFDEDLSDWDRVGWEWDRNTNKLKCFLTKGDKTWVVKIGLRKILKIFNKCASEDCGHKVEPYKQPTLNGFFKKLGRGLKKAVKGIGKGIAKAAKGIGKGIVRATTAPFRLIRNPKKFLKTSARRFKKTIKGVGKAVVNVASSPIFAGAMTALSAIPPIGTAIGGAGMAAFAAAKAIKPAFKVVEKGIDVVDSIANRKKRRRAQQKIAAMRGGMKRLPGPAQKLLKGALKTSAAPLRKQIGRSVSKQVGRGVFRVAKGLFG